MAELQAIENNGPGRPVEVLSKKYSRRAEDEEVLVDYSHGLAAHVTSGSGFGADRKQWMRSHRVTMLLCLLLIISIIINLILLASLLHGGGRSTGNAAGVTAANVAVQNSSAAAGPDSAGSVNCSCGPPQQTPNPGTKPTISTIVKDATDGIKDVTDGVKDTTDGVKDTTDGVKDASDGGVASCNDQPPGDNWLKRSQHYYLISTDRSTGWFEAKAKCEGYSNCLGNASLASVTDQDLDEFLRSHLESYRIYYIGLRNERNCTAPSCFSWAFGDTVEYTNWHENEPTLTYGQLMEPCVDMDPLGWNDVPCEYHHYRGGRYWNGVYYVCEWRLTTGL